MQYLVAWYFESSKKPRNSCISLDKQSSKNLRLLSAISHLFRKSVKLLAIFDENKMTISFPLLPTAALPVDLPLKKVTFCRSFTKQED